MVSGLAISPKMTRTPPPAIAAFRMPTRRDGGASSSSTAASLALKSGRVQTYRVPETAGSWTSGMCRSRRLPLLA
jgi:hypothetical protein